MCTKTDSDKLNLCQCFECTTVRRKRYERYEAMSQMPGTDAVLCVCGARVERDELFNHIRTCPGPVIVNQTEAAKQRLMIKHLTDQLAEVTMQRDKLFIALEHAHRVMAQCEKSFQTLTGVFELVASFGKTRQ